MKNTPKAAKNSIFAARVQAPPTCQPSRMTNTDPLGVQSADLLTIVILDLIEIIILYNIEMSVAAT